MKKHNTLILGIDTSNYKTSVAVTDREGQIICNYQEFLEVKKGERGLRQSNALFQHIMKLPELIEDAMSCINPDDIAGIAVSTRPRPVEGSYMPVFNAGLSTARTLGAALQVPVMCFSHQEGHIEAVKHYSEMRDENKLICFHFSGGTSEALLVEEGEDGMTIDIIGGSKDLAFGQVLDRLGVALGMSFPSGQEMDDIACRTRLDKPNILPKIKCQDGYINLSGIETKCQRSIGTVSDEQLITMTFQRLAESIETMCRQLADKYGIRKFLFAGGVSSSQYIRVYLQKSLKDFEICFGDPALSTDNAVGIAFLGGKHLWP
ncbi:MAG: O-sialoglycoprotein endopeptidase [Firmicutes bacterium]|nr:O-sialoglycoprotein endopeptidase [Bacillota bacterium]